MPHWMMIISMAYYIYHIKVTLLTTINFAHRKCNQQKGGGGWVSERALDAWKCKVQRFSKLASKAVLDPLLNWKRNAQLKKTI